MTDGSHQMLFFLANWTPALFVFAVGACVGSLLNVLVYRLPRGLPVVMPSSRCPSCQTKLTWRENIPILGWLLLKGRCRFCRCRISPEYPIVESLVAVLFLVLYVVWYLPHGGDGPIDLSLLRVVQPEWARNGVASTWPAFTTILVLVSCLVGMTIIDMKTFTIPLVLTWVPVVTALVLLPVNALLVGEQGLRHSAGTLGQWVMATPGPGGWWWTGACAGAALGLLIANAMLSLKLIGRSFADYGQWEAAALAEQGPQGEGKPDTPEMWVQYPHARREMVRELAFLAAPVGLAWLGGTLAARLAGDMVLPLWAQAVTGVVMGYLIGAAVVWGVRILGSLLFGKEAMGLGDVHVLAAIGACLGWPDAVLAFFAAVLAGLVSAVLTASAKKSARMLAFGPCLAIGALLVLLGKPVIEMGISALFPALEPINLP